MTKIFLYEISKTKKSQNRLLPIHGGIAKQIGNSQILKVNQKNVNSTGSAILSPILFKLSERSVCLCSTDMGKYTLSPTRDSPNPVLLTYSMELFIGTEMCRFYRGQFR